MHRRLAAVLVLVLVAVFALVALPTAASAQPSAVNVRADLAADRDFLAAHATAVCACRTVACANTPIDAYLRWQSNLILMDGQPDHAAYVAAVAADPAIANQRELLEGCHAALRMKPRVRVCKKRLASAATAFARAAPRASSEYRMLDFRDTPDPSLEPSGTIAAVRVHAGGVWSFRAVIGPSRAIVRDFGIDLDDIGDEWGHVASKRNSVTKARKAGPVVAVVEIESDPSGNFKPSAHPLTRLFLAKMTAAASKCMP